MFGWKKKQQSGASGQKDQNATGVDVASVYTMPKKYRFGGSEEALKKPPVQPTSQGILPPQSSSQPHSGRKARWLLLALVVFLGIGAVVIFFLIFSQQDKPEQKSEYNNAQLNTQKDQTSDEENTKQNQPVSRSTEEDASLEPKPKQESPEEIEQKQAPQETEVLDRDLDRLSDKEEAIFLTHINNKDTDNDGFSDGEEVANLYSPTDPTQQLANSLAIKTYSDEAQSFSFLYPANWLVQTTVNANVLRVFEDSGQYFSLELIEKTGDFESWYKENAKTQDAFSELGVFEHPKYGGYETLNKNCIYLDLGDRVAVVLYDTREKAAYFQTTFSMFARSFLFTKPAEPTNEPTVGQ